MFCYQCEQTAKGEGCAKIGVCGKKGDVAALQDLLVYALEGLSQVTSEGLKVGIDDREVGVFAVKALFTTLTNVNFDVDDLASMIRQAVRLRDELKSKVQAAGGKVDFADGPAVFSPASGMEELLTQAEQASIKPHEDEDADIQSLKHTLLFGAKGVAAYADHAQILGKEDPAVYHFIYEGLSSLLRNDLSLNDWIGLVLKCGEVNLRAMELLDDANTSTHGHPVPTSVPLGARPNKAILVSGHDLKDLEELLKQTEGKGIDVYTHGEMLPCHGYPELKKYGHLYGHYGTAWQNQAKEFARFPGAILMTTNCIQRPQEVYKDDIFTSGVVQWPGVTPVSDRDFSPVIERALELPGFTESANGQSVMVGFAHNTVMSVADQVIDTVKNKAILG